MGEFEEKASLQCIIDKLDLGKMYLCNAWGHGLIVRSSFIQDALLLHKLVNSVFLQLQ